MSLLPLETQANISRRGSSRRQLTLLEQLHERWCVDDFGERRGVKMVSKVMGSGRGIRAREPYALRKMILVVVPMDDSAVDQSALDGFINNGVDKEQVIGDGTEGVWRAQRAQASN